MEPIPDAMWVTKNLTSDSPGTARICLVRPLTMGAESEEKDLLQSWEWDGVIRVGGVEREVRIWSGLCVHKDACWSWGRAVTKQPLGEGRLGGKDLWDPPGMQRGRLLQVSSAAELGFLF